MKDATNMTQCWLNDESNVGYVLMVYLEYPGYIHNYHNDYPLLPKRLTVIEGMLSSYPKYLLKNRKYKETPKLIPNLNNKKTI